MWKHPAASVVLALLIAQPAVARDARHGYADGDHLLHRGAPRKDCTRLNGRWGYYGNPWCTKAEQRAFDRWEARRHRHR